VTQKDRENQLVHNAVVEVEGIAIDLKRLFESPD